MSPRKLLLLSQPLHFPNKNKPFPDSRWDIKLAANSGWKWQLRVSRNDASNLPDRMRKFIFFYIWQDSGNGGGADVLLRNLDVITVWVSLSRYKGLLNSENRKAVFSGLSLKIAHNNGLSQGF
ncbi:hypothetical protein AVEN_160803-1 [Araneus ventricosus]|uniref:Uncharacterized protein n=1 Tax=Araneus ventricosus TaxID=182803 RepID=A0A4Y2HP82_ARAVE|nr:hypothetical protein AVEN_160803-1 [Araneus ventricosus]